MKDISKVCLISCARLSSQRLPNKMMLPFAGSCLWEIYCKKVSKLVKEYNSQLDSWVSLYDPHLINIAAKYKNVNRFNRSNKSAHSDGPVNLIWDWASAPEFEKYTHFIYVNACSPCLTTETIENFIDHFLDSSSDNLFGGL